MGMTCHITNRDPFVAVFTPNGFWPRDLFGGRTYRNDMVYHVLLQDMPYIMYFDGKCPFEDGKEYPFPKWLWRLEAKEPEHGLWYDSDGNMVFDIGKLDCSTKDLPMGYDWRYQQDGKDWWSSCTNKDDLTYWYSKEDAQKLIDNEFVFARYLAVDFHEYENETVFLKETCLRREEVSLEDVFSS